MVNYERGHGGYTLNAAELADLNAALASASTAFDANKAAVGLGAGIYSAILKNISLPPLELETGTIDGGPIPGIAPEVYAWIKALNQHLCHQGPFRVG